MVSKLAPARFATMLMGLWLLTSFFGNFAAGAFGEKWDEWPPTDVLHDLTVLLAVLPAALRAGPQDRAMMHGVNEFAQWPQGHKEKSTEKAACVVSVFASLSLCQRSLRTP